MKYEMKADIALNRAIWVRLNNNNVLYFANPGYLFMNLINFHNSDFRARSLIRGILCNAVNVPTKILFTFSQNLIRGKSIEKKN